MNIKNILYSAVVGLAALASVACSNIDEDERLVYVKPAEVGRTVLIEDFTGQRCINCPRGTEAINSIVEEYGEENVIAVGIHSGPLGFAGSAKQVGLMTDTGNEYYNKWDKDKKIGQPWALFNRSAAPNSDYNTWLTAVKNIISQKAVLSVEISNTYDAATRQLGIDVKTMGTNGNTDGKLQVWIVEDGIKAMQLMPNGKGNADYIHNHVFRAAVNGTWGEDISVKEGVTTDKTYTYTLPEAWNADNVAVVAFVYNDSEVLQAARKAAVEKPAENKAQRR